MLVLVTIDIDNDSVSITDERTALSWRSIDVVPAMARLIRDLGLRATWFVRADSQLFEVYGTCTYLLDRFRPLWRTLRARGDEIAWHPHVYRRTSEGSYEPDRDDSAFCKKVVTTWRDLCAAGHRFTAVRVGEAYATNAVMHTLAQLGLRVDCTAIPGRFRNDKSRSFDWRGTPNYPYHPSYADYRLPGSPAFDEILEVPMTTAYFQAAYDSRPMLRYINPAYHPEIFRAGIERHFETRASSSQPRVISLVVHPDEVVADGTTHGLYARSLGALAANLAFVLDACRDASLTVCPARASDVPALLAGSESDHSRARTRQC